MKHQHLISQMTLEEKCRLLSGRDIWSTHPLPRLNIPSIFLADGPSGLRKQAGEGDHLGLNASLPATCWPTAATVANSWDLELAESIGTHVGAEAEAQGVDVVLGPALNIKRSALCGRNFEYFSEDPFLSGKLAGGYIKGIQSKNVAACPKHFAVNSQELHRMASDSVVDERTLREIYLTGFEIAVKQANPKAMMSAYNLLNGTYTNEHPQLLQDILVKEWGFDGAVVTDWGGSNDHIEGVRCGSHLEMPGTNGDSARFLTKAVQSGRLDEGIIDQRVNELLGLILSVGKAEATEPAPVNMAAHHTFARTAAENSIVLLKNQNELLPLPAGCKLAVIGDFAKTPRYQGAGSSIVNPTQLESVLDVIKDFDVTQVGYAAGYNRNGSENAAAKAEALRLASEADVVLYCFGLPEISEVEGLDRSHARLPQNQIDLLHSLHATNQNVVALLSAGSMVEMPWIDHCAALVYGCLGGQAGASAALRVITGQVCPSGKLAETFPFEYADAPVSAYYPGEQRTAEYREGIFVGYRYFETAKQGVRFPFGFGLSYTSFEYSGLQISETGVAFTLTNTGATAGAEVAQLYVGLPGSGVYRPAKELKGFAKVMLQPGESQTVTIDFEETTFRFFDAEADTMKTEAGTYDILVGASVADIRLNGTLAVQGEAPAPVKMRNALAPYYDCNLAAVPDSSFVALLGRSIPDPNWDTSGLLGPNDAICQMNYAKNSLARLVYRILTRLKNKSIAQNKPDLNILFIYNMPFRGLAKMTGGIVTLEMVDTILLMVNGHFFKGFWATLKAFRKGRKEQKQAAKQ